MLEHAYYSVISPEGCSAILWKSGEKTPDAAEALSLTSKDLLRLELVDAVIEEMIASDKPVIADIMVDQLENCYPMIPSGAAHNEMLLGPEDQVVKPISEEGMVLV